MIEIFVTYTKEKLTYKAEDSSLLDTIEVNIALINTQQVEVELIDTCGTIAKDSVTVSVQHDSNKTLTLAELIDVYGAIANDELIVGPAQRDKSNTFPDPFQSANIHTRVVRAL